MIYNQIICNNHATIMRHESVINSVEGYESPYKTYLLNISSFEKIRNRIVEDVIGEEVASLSLVLSQDTLKIMQEKLKDDDVGKIILQTYERAKTFDFEKDILLLSIERPDDAYALNLVKSNLEMLNKNRHVGLIFCTATLEYFIKDFLDFVFRMKPEIFKNSNNKFEFSAEQLIDVMRTGALESNVRDKIVNKILSDSREKWYQFIKERIGISIEYDDQQREIIALRNCCVHNGGKSDSVLCSINSIFNQGAIIKLSEIKYLEYIHHLNEIAGAIWCGYCDKFSYPDPMLKAIHDDFIKIKMAQTQKKTPEIQSSIRWVESPE